MVVKEFGNEVESKSPGVSLLLGHCSVLMGGAVLGEGEGGEGGEEGEEEEEEGLERGGRVVRGRPRRSSKSAVEHLRVQTWMKALE